MPRAQTGSVVIIGAGVIGVTTAYYLSEAGFDVTVVERQPGPALETSFANAGEISPGYASPWASPAILPKIPKWLLMQHAPLIVRPKADANMLRWAWRMLRNCTTKRYALNKERMVRLAQFSKESLVELRHTTGIAYDHRSQGTLQLFRTQRQLDGIAKDLKVLEHHGLQFEVLDRAGCLTSEPGLTSCDATIIGGLRLPGDETGDCYKFTEALAGLAAANGVTFHYNTRVQRLVTSNGKISHIETDQGDIGIDQVVLAAGSYSAKLLGRLGIYLPVYPIKGYSLTIPITDPNEAPVSTVLDETYKIAITRLGDRVRVGGMAELSGYGVEISAARKRTLQHSLNTLFPKAGDISQAEFWSGLRPMTPDSTPIVGQSPVSNLFLNTGHGTLGWTMACGSARLISALMAGHRAPIEAQDLNMTRYH